MSGAPEAPAPGTDGDSWKYPYRPTERQKDLHRYQPDELLYGGAAGGGKSEGLIAEGVHYCLLVPGIKVILFRRTYGDLEAEIIGRLKANLPEDVAHYASGAHVFKFFNDAELRLGYLTNPQDLDRYQGVEYQLVLFDELTQFRQVEYKYLLSRIRAAGPLRSAMSRVQLRPRMIATSNPGGRGHDWVKRRFVDPAPPNTSFAGWDEEEDKPDGLVRRYVPARMTDNPHLDQADYARRLGALDATYRRALLDGDWDILEGVRFTQFRKSIHVVPVGALDVPLVGYPRAVGVDYGGTAPFAALWGALLGDGLIYVYRELYAAGLTPRQQVQAILDAEQPGERIPSRPIPVALDPSTWARSANDPTVRILRDMPPPGSIARAYWDGFGTQLVKARNDRRMGAALLDEQLLVRPDGRPRLLISEQCVNLIRTLPSLVRSATDPEDVSTSPKQDDHLYDACRYLVMHLVVGTGDRRTSADDHRYTPVPGPLTAGLRT